MLQYLFLLSEIFTVSVGIYTAEHFACVSSEPQELLLLPWNS